MRTRAGVLVGVLSEILVDSIEQAANDMDLSQFFVGAFVVAVVGNAAAWRSWWPHSAYRSGFRGPQVPSDSPKKRLNGEPKGSLGGRGRGLDSTVRERMSASLGHGFESRPASTSAESQDGQHDTRAAWMRAYERRRTGSAL